MFEYTDLNGNSDRVKADVCVQYYDGEVRFLRDGQIVLIVHRIESVREVRDE